MSQTNKGIIFLIDFENVHNTGLDGVKYLEDNDSIIFFVSEPSAIKARREYLDTIANSGAEMEFRKLVKTGKNGLDFYIATELGFIKGKGEDRPIVIISGDTGYSAVIDYWKSKGTPNNIFLKPTIVEGIKTQATDHRYGTIVKETEGIDIGDFIKSRNNTIKQRQQAKTAKENWFKGIYEKTEYASATDDIMNIVENNQNSKELYSATIKKFGRKSGLAIYNLYKNAKAERDDSFKKAKAEREV